MHDYLFENQQAWKTTNDPLGVFEGYARTVGVPDIEKFKADYRSSDINDRINADLDAGRALGAEATPTFVLDGKKLEENPAGTPDAFAAILDEAIRAKGGTPPTTNAAPNTTPVTGGPDPIPTEDTSAQ
jgi:protein-disulfide isomerase